MLSLIEFASALSTSLAARSADEDTIALERAGGQLILYTKLSFVPANKYVVRVCVYGCSRDTPLASSAHSSSCTKDPKSSGHILESLVTRIIIFYPVCACACIIIRSP